MPALIFSRSAGHVANGTNRIAILAQNISAVTSFRHHGLHDFRLGLSLAACAVPGAIVGAWLGVQLQGIWFNRFLAAVMIGVMIVMALGERSKAKIRANGNAIADQPITRQRMIWGHVLMMGAGVYGGIIQIGVGFLLIAILHSVMRIDLVRVNMYKVFIVLCYTVAALAMFASQLELAWVADFSSRLAIQSVVGWEQNGRLAKASR